MKKIVSFALCLFMIVSMAMVSLADGGVSALREKADGLDLSYNVESCIGDIRDLHDQGVNVFDAGSLLSDEEAETIETILEGVKSESGFDLAIFTTDGFSGCEDAEDYADYIYYEAGLGTGDSLSGSILVINMTDGDFFIYPHGDAIRYITDSQQAYIFDELDGGLVEKLRNGDYAGACAVYAAGVLDAYQGGISSDQTNYNTETGEYDPYKKKGPSILDFIISLLASAGIASAPVGSVKKKYAMKAEKRMAEGFNLAYRANSELRLGLKADQNRLINRYVTSAPIPKSSSSGSRGGSGHGGGVSSVSSGRGGSVHGGSGRKL